jgi:hypothetical protein
MVERRASRRLTGGILGEWRCDYDVGGFSMK